ncbi:P-II family nitrogen regulator [Leptothermofonsia sichuanensis E412]|jgi:nitrogen regulatory protein PII|uniref:P-II family nitrogen regulator n=1 Tax=Leptothermofonsia sichuanensis TaxID=2917832 RepID=UPI001CA6AA4E|nr:P-II family nitrogen regulator [Leptothermofonsia sichuanensis]QZZ20786.1 P-II family nitrogen regulator [Leptothermofonsia sichuanensis E412]
MHPVKRIEIVSDSVELAKILEGLKKAGVSSYTVIHNVESKGIKGTAFDDSAVTMLDNAYVIAFCPPETVKPVIETIRPILNKFGGSCWISEVMEIRSVRCIASM